MVQIIGANWLILNVLRLSLIVYNIRSCRNCLVSGGLGL